MTEQHDPLNPNTRGYARRPQRPGVRPASHTTLAPRDEKEEHRRADRVDDPRQVPAAVRFRSCEPLLGPLARLRQVSPRQVPAPVRFLSCEPLLGPLARLRQVR